MKRYLLIPMLVIALLAGCQQSDDTATATPTPTPTPAPTEESSPSVEVTPTPAVEVTPTPEATEPIWAVQTTEYVETEPETGTVVYTGTFELPGLAEQEGFTLPQAWLSINTYYDVQGEALIAAAQEYGDWALGDFETATALGDTFYGYVEEQTYRISYQSEDLVSVVRTHYMSMGGAYPYTVELADTFQLSTGEKLTLDDLFVADYGDVLYGAFEGDEAVQTLGLTRENLEAAFTGTFFYLTDEGLVAYYPEGTFGGHAIGTISVLLPYETWEDIAVTWN